MPAKSLLVNLDAMIGRADLAQKSSNQSNYENISTISIRDFTKEGLVGPSLRKPDFQRETSHWSPHQVMSLLECFITGELIPSVILWQSETYLFVIDGGHRLSVLRSWVEDDYGDGPISAKFFGDAISKNQKAAAVKTRNLISDEIGSWQHFKTKIDTAQIDQKVSSVISRGLPIQWVKGDVEKAESSFFRINTQGTPLDSIEESLLKYRKRPIAISSRAVIRAGMGHKYWSRFTEENISEIETNSKDLHSTLFDPEITSPIKTLDLPLGGAKGIRAALQILIEYFSIANISQNDKVVKIDFGTDDETGDATKEAILKGLKLAKRITGNSSGSLGLHPAVYFYGPSGIHSIPMFLGTAMLISEKISNNDSQFFKTFTLKREVIESTLIANKDLIATVLQKTSSRKRVSNYFQILSRIYDAAKNSQEITQDSIVSWGGVIGKVIIGTEARASVDFTDETKSAAFIYTALKSAPKCPICNGYLDVSKSVSYDHIDRVRDGGKGVLENCQITHPYCNQSIKN
jgi:hypothetical protein